MYVGAAHVDFVCVWVVEDFEPGLQELAVEWAIFVCVGFLS